MKLYLSGKMSGEPNHGFDLFNATAEKLRALGHEVVNPADFGVTEGWSWEQYLERDILYVMQCEALAVLDNWDKSKGAAFEVFCAVMVGKPVFRAATMEQKQVRVKIEATSDDDGFVPMSQSSKWEWQYKLTS